MAKLPNYVTEKEIPQERLIQTTCKMNCGGATRYFEVSRIPWGKDEQDNELYATCLMCGSRTFDNYNW